MPVTTLPLDAEHVFDLCTKHLARDVRDLRHNYLGAMEEGGGRYGEGWRFPCVEPHFDGNAETSAALNRVTFIYFAPAEAGDFSVGVRGTFAPLYEITPLQRADDSRYFATTFLLPAAQVFRYRFVTSTGGEELDVINPQTTTEDNGARWSCFFTLACFEAVTFERWERVILDRLTRHILPFNTADARVFLERLSNQQRADHPYLHRFDLGVGVVNFLDKLLARPERHQLGAYKTCLSIIDQVLRQRNPYLEPRDVREEVYVGLYNEMATGSVAGWDYARYNDPRHFLQMLRRHTITAAFSHPKYGGNAAAAAWDYLSARYRDGAGKTLFDWRRSIEAPLGTSMEYRG
ncbi:MAG: gluconate 2-dehydrogenase subunit 3 family protein [Opitutaceae bacterium]